MHFKSSHGFSLIESMLAVAILGLVLTPMFILENNVFNGVFRMAEQFHRMIFAKNFLYVAQQQEPVESTKYTLERKEDRPFSMIRYRLSPVDRRSSLAPMKRLLRQQVEATGTEKTSPKATIVQFIFKPEQP